MNIPTQAKSGLEWATCRTRLWKTLTAVLAPELMPRFDLGIRVPTWIEAWSPRWRGLLTLRKLVVSTPWRSAFFAALAGTAIILSTTPIRAA